MQSLHIARMQKSMSRAADKADNIAAAAGAGNINYQFYRHIFAEPGPLQR